MSTTFTSNRIEAHIATLSIDFVEVRIRGLLTKPSLTVSSVSEEKHDGNTSNDSTKVEISRGVSRGHWRCFVSNLMPGTSYSIRIGGDEDDDGDIGEEEHLEFCTLDTAGLGKRRLRIGIIADPHVNLRSSYYNGKRLYGSANALLERYATKLAAHHEVDCLVLPGDVCDTGSKQELAVAAQILDATRQQHQIPVYAVIGNHERDPRQFSKLLTPLNPCSGYYSVDTNGVHLIFLATVTQDSLNEGMAQLEWLRRDLAHVSQSCDVILVFLHYSLVLHPLHNDGQWDDGLQVLDNANALLDLLHSYPLVRAVCCGHKNVPSLVVDEKGLLHTLSPQLIQVPCGYDVMDIYDHGLTRVVCEIEETDLQEVSRYAAGEQEALERWGKQEHRSFRHDWL